MYGRTYEMYALSFYGVGLRMVPLVRVFLYIRRRGLRKYAWVWVQPLSAFLCRACFLLAMTSVHDENKVGYITSRTTRSTNQTKPA